MNKKAFFLATLALLGVVLAGSFLYEDQKADQVSTTDTDSVTDLPTEKDSEEVIENQAPPKKTLPIYSGQPIAFLGNDPIIDQVSQEVVNKRRQMLAELAVSLSNDPNDFDGWMTVAYIKKIFNNYEGARDAWEYAKQVVSNSPLPYLNLGDLYGYYLRDLEKAEGNLLAAIQFDFSGVAGALQRTAFFYKDFGMIEKALQRFEELLRINPDEEWIKEEIRRLEESN